MSRLDKGLLFAVLGLIGLGLVQVYSSSFIFATESRGDGLYFFKRQLFFAALALPCLFAVALTPWKWIERYGFLLWFVAGAAIAATFIPGLGLKAGGASRWLRLPGGVVFEPSELLKISLPLIFAWFAARREAIFGAAEWPVRALVIGLPLVLVLAQRDFGSFFICVAVLFCLLFAFGLRWLYIAGGATLGLPLFYFLVMSVPYRRARIMAFLDPWADPAGKGFQVIQSMLSVQSGGLTGVGLGQGQGKLFFLPEAHTDFTLAVLGEEMGFIGICVALMMYGYCVFRGLQIAARTDEVPAKAIALGLSLTFGFQVFINVGVNLGLLPTKGLTLPFLSYGGSSLLISCLLFGVLLSVERHERERVPSGERVARLFRDAGAGRRRRVR
ncbi:MAG: putative lipid II flippase FtsW [Bdellovibrionaceae bacterium]|nr:putative lipid II flippase FtsW [Pseudobdellovibrionaceae bacterium]